MAVGLRGHLTWRKEHWTGGWNAGFKSQLYHLQGTLGKSLNSFETVSSLRVFIFKAGERAFMGMLGKPFINSDMLSGAWLPPRPEILWFLDVSLLPTPRIPTALFYIKLSSWGFKVGGTAVIQGKSRRFQDSFFSLSQSSFASACGFLSILSILGQWPPNLSNCTPFWVKKNLSMLLLSL